MGTAEKPELEEREAEEKKEEEEPEEVEALKAEEPATDGSFPARKGIGIRD